MRLWLDDQRKMPDDYDFHVDTVEDAISLIKEMVITHVGFDHDLGTPNTGYDLACWIEEAATMGLPRMTWSIQSDNPVGVKKIYAAMRKADRYWDAAEAMCRQHTLFDVVSKHFGDTKIALYWYTHIDDALGITNDKEVFLTPLQILLDNNGDRESLRKFILKHFKEEEV